MYTKPLQMENGIDGIWDIYIYNTQTST
jgi:hypothetical protein